MLPVPPLLYASDGLLHNPPNILENNEISYLSFPFENLFALFNDASPSGVSDVVYIPAGLLWLAAAQAFGEMLIFDTLACFIIISGCYSSSCCYCYIWVLFLRRSSFMSSCWSWPYSWDMYWSINFCWQSSSLSSSSDLCFSYFEPEFLLRCLKSRTSVSDRWSKLNYGRLCENFWAGDYGMSAYEIATLSSSSSMTRTTLGSRFERSDSLIFSTCGSISNSVSPLVKELPSSTFSKMMSF